MAEASRSPTLEARRAQMFPVLAAEEIARIRRFGTPRRYGDGEHLFETGKTAPGLFVVLSGLVRVTRRDGLAHEVPLVEYAAGSFSGEIGQLSGKRAFADGVAEGAVETLLVGPDQLRALLVAEAALGEKIMRALILRHVGLMETGSGGPVLIGSPSSADVLRLRSFLSRNGYPHQSVDAASDEDARPFIERYAPSPEDLPLVICPDGTVLRNPAESELAKCIGMLDGASEELVYDVAVVGAGPAGLATAVYAASEGLSVVVIDARSYGGQAGASARIENYFGFPTGISGQALTGRAYAQALKFGARMAIPAEAVRLDCDRSAREPLALRLADERSFRSRTAVVATGARYRRPDCANLKAMEGNGVWYWASPIEAKMCAGQEIVLVGGGNSAGQAAVFLAGHAAKVWMLVRGEGLAASMSSYLIERIAAIPNIELRTRTEIVGLTGSRQSGVESVRWRQRDTGHEETRAIRNVFMFLGADPSTEWLKDCDVALDGKGFVRTGVGGLPLETSVRGVFAIGDVRAGSVKRVGGAIGEGAAVVAQIHAWLAAEHSADVLLSGAVSAQRPSRAALAPTPSS
jgi:thioredoxin reductase (NADPH)